MGNLREDAVAQNDPDGVPAANVQESIGINRSAGQGLRKGKKWPSIFKKAAGAVKNVAKNAFNAAKKSVKQSVSNAVNRFKEAGRRWLGGGGGKKGKDG